MSHKYSEYIESQPIVLGTSFVSPSDVVDLRYLVGRNC